MTEIAILIKNRHPFDGIAGARLKVTAAFALWWREDAYISTRYDLMECRGIHLMRCGQGCARRAFPYHETHGIRPAGPEAPTAAWSLALRQRTGRA